MSRGPSHHRDGLVSDSSVFGVRDGRKRYAKMAPTMDKDAIILMNLCGRGDKDIFTVAEALGVKL